MTDPKPAVSRDTLLPLTRQQVDAMRQGEPQKLTPRSIAIGVQTSLFQAALVAVRFPNGDIVVMADEGLPDRGVIDKARTVL